MSQFPIKYSKFRLLKDVSGLKTGSIVEGNRLGDSIFAVINNQGVQIPLSAVEQVVEQPANSGNSSPLPDKKKFPTKTVLIAVASAVLIVAILRYQKLV